MSKTIGLPKNCLPATGHGHQNIHLPERETLGLNTVGMATTYSTGEMERKLQQLRAARARKN